MTHFASPGLPLDAPVFPRSFLHLPSPTFLTLPCPSLSASEVTYIVSGGPLNSTHSLPVFWSSLLFNCQSNFRAFRIYMPDCATPCLSYTELVFDPVPLTNLCIHLCATYDTRLVWQGFLSVHDPVTSFLRGSRPLDPPSALMDTAMTAVYVVAKRSVQQLLMSGSRLPAVSSASSRGLGNCSICPASFSGQVS